MLDRRQWLAGAGVFAFSGSALAVAISGGSIDLMLPGGPGNRPITTDFPKKDRMILQRIRPPLLETPFDVFDNQVFTPNNRFFVRWHWAVIPTAVDAEKFRLAVHGHVERELSLSLRELQTLPEFEIVAVNQCSGNSRGFFAPRVPGGQWGNGAMGNARWTGVRLKDVLDRAGVKSGGVQVRFGGLDQPVVPQAPDFMKSLAIDHARDGEVMIAYAMNGEQLPLLNGFPLRLVVPGWYSTYWIKMLNDIEVLAEPDQNFWMKTAYLIPDTPNADMKPGQAGVSMVPISRMNPRSFITNLAPNTRLEVGASVTVRGIAFGGNTGVSKVEFSADGGNTWTQARLGPDEGKYSFRVWDAGFVPHDRRLLALMSRCTNSDGSVQPMQANWNPGGYMRNVVESVAVTSA